MKHTFTTRQIPGLLLAIAGFLAVLIGGQVVTESQMIFGGASPVILALMGDASVPLLTHALIGTITVMALMTFLGSNRVFPMPAHRLGLMVIILAGLLAASALTATFRGPAFAALVQWGFYILAFFTSAAVVGREHGPRLVLYAIFIACTLLAVRGLMEYAEMKATDPTWRVFAGWINPNATAAMLMVGWFLGLGLTQLTSRVGTLLSVLGLAVIGLGILLTQSKGVLLVTAGLSVLTLIFGAVQNAEKSRLKVPAAAMVLVLIMGFGLTKSQAPAATEAGGASATALTRLGNAGGTAEQSAGFRTLLWKGAIDLIESNPIGYGLGGYRFESARPGLTTQTVFAHNSYLQMAVDSSILAPLLLFAIGIAWLTLMFKGYRNSPPEKQIIRLAIITAVLAVAAHGFVDSDLSYFGIGFVFFLLMGLGSTVAADAIAPELLLRPYRLLALSVPVLFLIFAMFISAGEVGKAKVRAGLISGERSVSEELSSLQNLAPYDGETDYLTGQYRMAMREAGAVESYRLAATKSPSPRNYRVLARTQESLGNYAAAMDSLRSALRRDPNNLPALAQLMRTQSAFGTEEDSINTAKQLLAVEKTTYYQIRSLPELVPTETAEARIFLAERLPQDAAREEWLTGAIDIYNRYVASTVPLVERTEKYDPGSNFGGETMRSAKAKMEMALKATKMLAEQRQRTGGDVAEVTAWADGFAAVLAK